MNPALLILNPRAIPECVDAIEALDIPKCWISYMPEPQAALVGNEIIRATDYSHYVILSDDTVPTQRALDLVLEQLKDDLVVTGYCNMDQGPFRGMVNLTSNRLPKPPPYPGAYKFRNRAWIEAQEPPVVTTFAGLALTGMARDMWLNYPLQTTVYGGQMDYDLSYRLQEADIPIVVAQGAYIEHVKERWNHPDQNPQKRLLVGERDADVRWTGVEELAA